MNLPLGNLAETLKSLEAASDTLILAQEPGGAVSQPAFVESIHTPVHGESATYW